MISHPSKKIIADLYLAGKPQVAWTTLIADLETPVSAMLKLADGRSNSFLLESVEGGKVRGRFSIIGMNPDIIWKFKKKIAQINVCGAPLLWSRAAMELPSRGEVWNRNHTLVEPTRA